MNKKTIIIIFVILILCSMIMTPASFYMFAAATTTFTCITWFISGSIWTINLILNTRNLFVAIEQLIEEGK